MKSIIGKARAGMEDRMKKIMKNPRGGMELVQVAIIIAIAIIIGLIFRSRIEEFVENVFANLSAGKFL